MKKGILSALLLCVATAVFASEDLKPIWQQGTVILIQVISFLVLIFFLKSFLFKPVLSKIEERKKEISDEYSDAEEANKSAEELKIEYEKKLADCDLEIREKIAEAVRDGQKLADAKISSAAIEVERRLSIAEEEILREKDKALYGLKDTSASLGVKIASKILDEELDAKKHEELINKFIKELDGVK